MLRCRRLQRQLDCERRALADQALDADAALVLLDNLTADAEAEQRQALEWVQSVGGLIRVVIDGKHVEVFPRQQIPRRPLRVYWVNLRGIRRVNDTTLEKLKAAPPIRQVYLDGTAITNAGLAKLATYPGFARLRILNVTRTALTDAGLEHVARFTALDILRAGETKITAAGVSKLSAALPRCKVAWDGVPTEVKPAIDEPTGFTNALGMEFALVPKGKAWMGGMAGTHGNNEVELKEDFYLGVYEVTQEEWQQIMGVNPSEYTRTGKEKELVKDLPDAELKRLPVTHVSWNDCQEFIARLNERTKESGWVYRLPKAEEWQYACRGGSLPKKEDYAFDYYFDRPTNTLLPDRANFNNTLKRPAKVGSYPPNALGLYDMHGNMAELLDEALPEGKWGPHTRVTRGGGFSHPAEWCRTVFHITTPHNARFHDIGLRLARVKK
jgi:formylglycine-generating enzyme required for sulfatase activity